jgi:ribosomal protein L25 (general stress protein Ctc)
MRKKRTAFNDAKLIPLFRRMIKNAHVGGSWGKCVLVVYGDGSGSLRICDGADETKIGVKDVDFDRMSDLISKVDEYSDD